MPAARTLASVWAAKTAGLASRALGRGGGTAVSGLVGLRLQPELIGELASQLGQGSVIITGTNGKTTTSRLVAEVTRAAGLLPLANASGSNLVRGLAATLAQAVDASGSLPGAKTSIGVFEVDEATLPLVLSQLRPRAIVFTNLFRDQLDRYGEVEAVAALWRRALEQAPAETRLVLNADDPSIASLGEGRESNVYYGVDDISLDKGCIEHAADALSCRCGARYEYDAVHFGHVGHWRCAACGRARPAPQVAATEVDLRDGRSAGFRLSTSGASIELGVGGLYNVYNALAAAAAAQALGLRTAAVTGALNSTGAAFGRQESFELDGRTVELFLCKNPAGVNQVLDTLRRDPQRKSALILLNDGIADGRDISWVWDADYETMSRQFASVVVSGTRAAELALRLKYAEWPEDSLRVVPDIAEALDVAIASTLTGGRLTVLPTYTAMLTVRALLARRAGRPPFWQ